MQIPVQYNTSHESRIISGYDIDEFFFFFDIRVGNL